MRFLAGNAFRSSVAFLNIRMNLSISQARTRVQVSGFEKQSVG
jgi:hypothetical protein